MCMYNVLYSFLLYIPYFQLLASRCEVYVPIAQHLHSDYQRIRPIRYDIAELFLTIIDRVDCILNCLVWR